jgi:hypothetical protein
MKQDSMVLSDTVEDKEVCVYLSRIEACGCNWSGEYRERHQPQAAQPKEEGPGAQLCPGVQDAILESRVFIHLQKPKMAKSAP